MKVEEIAELLRKAVYSICRNDIYSFRDLTEQAKKIASDFPQDHPIHGEIELMSIFRNINDPDALCGILERSRSLIKGNSKLMLPKDGDIENFVNMYSLWGQIPGCADETASDVGKYAQAIELIKDVCHVGYGMLELLKAQLAFYRGEFDDAKKYAEQCRKKNEQAYYRESIIDVYALEILAGVAKHKKDGRAWSKAYYVLKQIAEGKMNASRAGCEHAQVVVTMIDQSLGLLHDVPVWGRTGEIGVIPAPWGYELLDESMLASVMPNAMIAHIEYLAFSGAPVRALMTAGVLQNNYGFRNVILTANLELLRADCYLQLNKPRRATEAIENALDFIIPDRLWTIAAEYMPEFGGKILEVARARSPEAAERIAGVAQDYESKIILLRNSMLCENDNFSLTKRESEIAELAVAGCTNAEIAEKLNITVRTVKAHMEHIFDKFNVSRRSQLINVIGQTKTKRMANWVK